MTLQRDVRTPVSSCPRLKKKLKVSGHNSARLQHFLAGTRNNIGHEPVFSNPRIAWFAWCIARLHTWRQRYEEIGRASCRERGEVRGVGGRCTSKLATSRRE